MYERIVIIGSAGAGKSTLAQKLGSLLNIQVIHLDCYFWQPKWREKPRGTRIEILKKLVQDECWIIEGTYLSSSDSRLYAANTIIFLDMPRYLCFLRVIKRRFLHAKKPRPDLPQGCREKLSIPYILKVLVFPYRGRNLLLEKIEEIQKHEAMEPDLPKKIIRTYRSRREVDAFLRELSAHLQEVHTHEENKPVQESAPALVEV